MPNFTGSALSKVQSQTMVAVPGHDDRQIGVALLNGTHTSLDQKFDKARITYVGIAATVGNSGEQKGHFENVHRNGDTTQGTFEAKMTIDGNGMRLDGTWRFTGGSGSLSGIRGSGVFQSEMTSLTDSKMTWSGSYEQ